MEPAGCTPPPPPPDGNPTEARRSALLCGGARGREARYTTANGRTFLLGLRVGVATEQLLHVGHGGCTRRRRAVTRYGAPEAASGRGRRTGRKGSSELPPPSSASSAPPSAAARSEGCAPVARRAAILRGGSSQLRENYTCTPRPSPQKAHFNSFRTTLV